jgi:DNA polymerase I
VKAAKKLQALGIKVGSGDIISYVKTKDKEGVTPLQLARKENVDVDKYIEYMRSAFEQILDPLEIDFDSIVGLTSLESFM